MRSTAKTSKVRRAVNESLREGFARFSDSVSTLVARCCSLRAMGSIPRFASIASR